MEKKSYICFDKLTTYMRKFSLEIIKHYGINSPKELNTSAQLWDAYRSIPIQGNENLTLTPDPFSPIPDIWPTIHKICVYDYSIDNNVSVLPSN